MFVRFTANDECIRPNSPAARTRVQRLEYKFGGPGTLKKIWGPTVSRRGPSQPGVSLNINGCVGPGNARPCNTALVASPKRVGFKVAVTAFRVLHGLAPLNLSQLTRVADLSGRRRLRSSSSKLLQVSPFRPSTVGRRSFPSRIHCLELLAIGQ